MRQSRVVRAVVAAVALVATGSSGLAQDTAAAAQGSARTGSRPGRALTDYAPVLRTTIDRVWAIDPSKGVETRRVADGVYVITDGVWQSAFAVTGAGVVVFDAPETYAGRIRAEIAAVTSQPVTTLVYSHSHKDHIGGSAAFADLEGLEIVALTSVGRFLAEKKDPNRLMPTRTFDDKLVLERGGTRIELRATRHHSNEGDLIVYLPRSRFLMAIDTLAPGYCPFMGFDITSNFHEYLGIFDVLLAYDFDAFVGGHLTHVGSRADVELTGEFTRDVYETVKRVHRETDMMGVFTETAGRVGGFDNKYLLFKTFLDVVTARAAAEIEQRWVGRLAGVDVFAEDHVRTALIYVRWDD